jgi:hypothetical protein
LDVQNDCESRLERRGDIGVYLRVRGLACGKGRQRRVRNALGDDECLKQPTSADGAPL